MGETVRHCLPGEGRGDETWFYRLNAFEQQEIRRQVAFKRNHWPELKDGAWSKRPNYQYPHILPENHIKEALYQPVAAQILKYVHDEDIALHSEALNLRSSQVCCFNVLFPLREDKELGRLVLAPLLPGVRAVEAIEFEYTGPEGTTEWLGEPPGGKRGQNRTSIDAAIWWRDSTGIRWVTLVEWKYTERSFGSCGGYASEANATKKSCHSLDASNIRSERECFLTRGGPQTSRRYWEHLKQAGINRARFMVLRGCPFRGPFYQLLRQSLLAVYLRQREGIAKVEVATLVFGQNKSLLSCPSYLMPLAAGRVETGVIGAWNAVIPSTSPVRHVTVEEIISAADSVLSKDDPWRSYVRERYGV